MAWVSAFVVRERPTGYCGASMKGSRFTLHRLYKRTKLCATLCARHMQRQALERSESPSLKWDADMDKLMPIRYVFTGGQKSGRPSSWLAKSHILPRNSSEVDSGY
ncbi:hypothetical protein KCU88_g360, partial [Aureobasidium melanogenum]